MVIPAMSEREGEPDEPLPRVALGDQQRVVAERRAARSTGPVPAETVSRRRRGRPACVEVLDDRRSRRRSCPVTRYGQRSGRRRCRRRPCSSRSWRPEVAAGDADTIAVRRGRPPQSVIGTGAVPQRLAGRRRGRRGPAPARTRSGGTCSRATDSGSLTRIVLRAISLAVLVDREVGREVGRPGRSRSRAPRSRGS